MLMQNFAGTKKGIMEFLKKAYKLNKKPLQTLTFLFIFSQTDWCLQLWRVTLRALYQPNTEPWRETATNRTDVEQKSERVSGTVRGWRSSHSLVNDPRHCCVRTNDNVKHACTPFSFATFAYCTSWLTCTYATRSRRTNVYFLPRHSDKRGFQSLKICLHLINRTRFLAMKFQITWTDIFRCRRAVKRLLELPDCCSQYYFPFPKYL